MERGAVRRGEVGPWPNTACGDLARKDVIKIYESP